MWSPKGREGRRKKANMTSMFHVGCVYELATDNSICHVNRGGGGPTWAMNSKYRVMWKYQVSLFIIWLSPLLPVCKECVQGVFGKEWRQWYSGEKTGSYSGTEETSRTMLRWLTTQQLLSKECQEWGTIPMNGQLIRDVTTVSHSNSTTIKYCYRHLSDGLEPQAFLTSMTDWAAQMYQMCLYEVRALHSPTWSPARYWDICPLLYSLIMNSNVFPSLDACFWPLRGRTGV